MSSEMEIVPYEGPQDIEMDETEFDTEEPMDCDGPALIDKKLAQWYQQHGGQTVSLGIAAASLAWIHRTCLPFIFQDDFLPFGVWLNYAASTWLSPEQWIGVNSEFLFKLQPFLRDYQKSYSKVRGNKLERSMKRFRMVSLIFPMLNEYQVCLDMPTMHIEATPQKLLFLLSQFPLMSSTIYKVTSSLPAGSDYFATCLYTIILRLKFMH